MLQSNGSHCAEAFHQSADRRSRLRHPDEYFARLAIRIETDCQISFVSPYREVVRDGLALIRKPVPVGFRRTIRFAWKCCYVRLFCPFPPAPAWSELSVPDSSVVKLLSGISRLLSPLSKWG